MQEVDAAQNELSAGRSAMERSSGMDAPRRPDPAAVLEVLAALEVEFEAVLRPRSAATGVLATHDIDR
jgi:hypothetical protein